MEDPFEPVLLSSADAGVLKGAVDAGDSAEVPAQQPDGCSVEGAAGSGAPGGDTSCLPDIGLVAPEQPVTDTDGDVEDGEGDEDVPAAPLSLPTCSSGFGAFGVPERITGLGFEGDVFGPNLSTDGRVLYFSAYVGGTQEIYSATRDELGTEFSNVTALSVINSPAMDGTPFVTRDGLHLYFFSERTQGVGNRDIWISERASVTSEFSAPVLLAAVNTPSSELLPWLAEDELGLLFVSSRPGGRGGSDVWRMSRGSTDAAFGSPVNVFELNSTQNEGRLVLTADGLTAFFTSDRNGQAPDIYTASRERVGIAFSPPRLLAPLNSSNSELDVSLSRDETELFFASYRGGGNSELWRSVRRCEPLE